MANVKPEILTNLLQEVINSRLDRIEKRFTQEASDITFLEKEVDLFKSNKNY